MIDSFMVGLGRLERTWLLVAVGALVAAVAFAVTPSVALGGPPGTDVIAKECVPASQPSAAADPGVANDCPPEPCPVVQVLADASCLPEPCRPDEVFTDTGCVPEVPCEPGFYLRDGICKPEVTKTAYTKWIQRITWDIDKNLRLRNGRLGNEQRWKIFWGDSVWANYVVDLTKNVENKYSVHGKIRIPLEPFSNGVTRGAIRIVDEIELRNGKKINVPVKCDGYDSVPETVEYRGELVCEYWLYLDRPVHGVNRVWVWIGDYPEPMTAEETFWFEETPTRIHGPERVWIRDSNFPDQNRRGPFETTRQFRYPLPFVCDEKQNPLWHTNVAELLVPIRQRDTPRVLEGIRPVPELEVAKSASATIHIHCVGLDVRTDAKTKFKRIFKWDIDKRASHRHIELASHFWQPKKGHPKAHKWLPDYAVVKYRVDVDSYPEDFGHRAWGKIYVTNEHPHRSAHIVELKDVIRAPGADPIDARVWCNGGKDGGDFGLPAWIPAGATLTCYWRARLPDANDRRNVARVELQNHHLEARAQPRPDGTTWFRGRAPIRFGEPHELIDEKAVVLDTFAPKGLLGVVDQSDTPARFRYAVLVTAGDQAPKCGKGWVYNQATLIPNDSGARLEASVNIPVFVTCFDPKKDPPKKDPPKKDPPRKHAPPKCDTSKKKHHSSNKGESRKVATWKKGGASSCDPPKKDPRPKADPPKQTPPVVKKHPPVVKKHPPVKVDPPKDDVIVCVPGNAKPWHLIGPHGKKTDFFASGYTYKQVMRKGLRGKSRHYRLGRAYINAKLLIVAGAKYGKRIERSTRWAERYFASHAAKGAESKRGLKANKAKKLRRAIYRKKRVLIRYAKHAKVPRCELA